eukprot:2368587-Alexandrium_andersonii.AAC.1
MLGDGDPFGGLEGFDGEAAEDCEATADADESGVSARRGGRGGGGRRGGGRGGRGRSRGNSSFNSNDAEDAGVTRSTYRSSRKCDFCDNTANGNQKFRKGY